MLGLHVVRLRRTWHRGCLSAVMPSSSFRRSLLSVFLLLGVTAANTGCASDDGATPNEDTSDLTRSELLAKMKSLVTNYKDAEWDLKKKKYTEAANLVYATYGLSSLVKPAVQSGLIVVLNGVSPVMETNTSMGSPRISITTRHLELAVSSPAYLDNFVSILTHEYIHVWQSFSGYSGTAKHDEREFLANAFNVLGGGSYQAKEIFNKTGFDLGTIPRVVEPQRMINAAAVVKTYGPRRGNWGVGATRSAAYDAEFDAVKAVYDTLAKTYKDNGAKKN